MAKTDKTKASAKKKTATDGPKAASSHTASPKRNTRMRTALIVIAGMIVLVAILVLNAGGFTRAAIEKIAGDTLGVPVTLASLDIDLQQRQVDAGGVAIGNPEGFRAPNAITMGAVHIAASEISGATLEFDQIRITDAAINLEVAKNGTNLTALHDMLDARASTLAGNGREPVRVIIHDLLLEGATLNPVVTLGGTAPMKPVTMPNIHITGIGEQGGGVTPSEAMTLVADRVILVAMRTAVQNRYLQGMDEQSLTQIEKALGLPTGIVDQMRDFGEKMRNLFEN